MWASGLRIQYLSEATKGTRDARLPVFLHGKKHPGKARGTS